MKKNLFFILFLLSFSLSLIAADADPKVSTDIPNEEDKFDPNKSHLEVYYGFNNFNYSIPFPVYAGTTKNIVDPNFQTFGPRIGLGTQIYLFSGFSLMPRIDGYYSGLVNGKDQVARNTAGSVISSKRQVAQMYGGDASLALGWQFEMKSRNPFLKEMFRLTVQPFVEVGMGRSSGLYMYQYHYDDTSKLEDYNVTIKDSLKQSHAALGFNLTARSGFFFYYRLSVNKFVALERKQSGSLFTNGNSGTPSSADRAVQKNVSLDSITSHAIGGGYRF